MSELHWSAPNSDGDIAIMEAVMCWEVAKQKMEEHQSQYKGEEDEKA